MNHFYWFLILLLLPFAGIDSNFRIIQIKIHGRLALCLDTEPGNESFNQINNHKSITMKTYQSIQKLLTLSMFLILFVASASMAQKGDGAEMENSILKSIDDETLSLIHI